MNVADLDDVVEMYTDGACRRNPGPGGWGVLLRYRGREKTLCGGEPETTNNRMELTAAIRGLEALKRRSRVRITTDSEYLKNGLTQWLPAWRRRGWLTADRKPVKNADLWRHLADLAAGHELEWHWVRGHTGHPENERADQLANEGLDQMLEGRVGAQRRKEG